MAGPRLGTAAEAAEAGARPGVTLRPFAPLSGPAEADEGGGDWSFIDCEMEEVDLQDLPSATIACHLDPRVFVDGLCRVSAAPGGPSGRRADTCCPRRRRESQRPVPAASGAGRQRRPRGPGPRTPQGWGVGAAPGGSRSPSTPGARAAHRGVPQARPGPGVRPGWCDQRGEFVPQGGAAPPPPALSPWPRVYALEEGVTSFLGRRKQTLSGDVTQCS